MCKLVGPGQLGMPNKCKILITCLLITLVRGDLCAAYYGAGAVLWFAGGGSPVKNNLLDHGGNWKGGAYCMLLVAGCLYVCMCWLYIRGENIAQEPPDGIRGPGFWVYTSTLLPSVAS
jgi:hypothetical protein